jgi:photosystem II stability/assembly factor-like uncharacterized protein
MLIGAGETVRYSIDAGKKWTTCQGPAGPFTGAYFRAGGNMFVSTENGVWHSENSGRSWNTCIDGLPFEGKGARSLTGGTKDNHTTLYCTLPGKNENEKYVGGIYRWTTTTKKWQPVDGEGLVKDLKKFDTWGRNDVTQFHHILTTDKNPEIVWASNTGTGIPVPHHSTIYRSTDSGKTWQATFFPDPRYKNFNVQKDYFVTEDGQFYQNLPQLTVDSHNPDRLLTIVSGKCYFTEDAGKSWKCGHIQPADNNPDPKPGQAWKNTGLVVTTTWNYYIDPHEPLRHYICYTDIGFARSLDGGKTFQWWGHKDSSPWRNTCYELAFDPDQPGKIFGAFSNTHDIPHGNVIHNRHKATYPGGICLSTDFGATWKVVGEKSLPKSPPTSIVMDPKSDKKSRTLYAATFGDGVYKSTDDGATWTPKNNNLGHDSNRRVCKLQLHPDGTLFALVTALVKGREFQQPGVGLFRSKDAGDNWECITQSTPTLWPKDFTVNESDSTKILLGMADANDKQIGGLYRTVDAGKSWQRIFKEGRQHFGGYWSKTNPTWIYATLAEGAPRHGLYLSKDDGKTFAPLPGMPFDNTHRITHDPANPNQIYVTTFGGSVWKGPAE